MSQKYYVVWKGRKPGIYLSWEECQKQVIGFSNALFKSFKSLEEAQKAYNDVNYLNTKKLINDYPQTGICVDAAYSCKTKQMYYRAVLLPEKKELFKKGPFENSTNNIGEFLAIVEALRFCREKNLDLPIFSDSVSALAWVKNKKINSKIDAYENNQTSELLKEAIKWLSENNYLNELIKWDTKKWGENPADFGNK
jgi:ribonuclease HI